MANLPDENESDYHQVITIYFTKKKSDFFTRKGEIKKRWLAMK